MGSLSKLIDFDKQYSEEIPSVSLSSISIIMPVKNNQAGVDLFLDTFFSLHNATQYPKEIVIVDNNSDIPLRLNRKYTNLALSIKVVVCRKKGPAAARNYGADETSGDWLLFCDSDCLPTGSFLSGYLSSESKAIAFAGHVMATPPSSLSRYYDEEKTLVPYLKTNKAGEPVPVYLVTANALVWRAAFLKCGRFDETFSGAGGEDVDLALRLWNIGNLAYLPETVVLHDFRDGFTGFCRRFVRYGRGNRQLQQQLGITLSPAYRSPRRKSAFNIIARLIQHVFMMVGYFSENAKFGWRDWRSRNIID